MSPNEILTYWFTTLTPEQWWKKDPALDQDIKTTFLECHTAASKGECSHWRTTIEGRLAEIIVLDQFSRNIYRDTPQAFSQDGMALILAQTAIELGLDTELSPTQRSFLYLPYMHSESLSIHEDAVTLFNQPGMETNYAFEIKHKVIIERFGRYPHRNQILGRHSTPEEIAFLKEPGSSF